MSTPRGSAVSPELVQTLLALPDREEQVAKLRAANLLNPEGLSRLLDEAARLARSDPGQARRLAALCADVAERAAAPAAIPRAAYIRAQAHAVNGEFNLALSLIAAARAGYEALGEHMEALRTNVGLMHVLNELGRHQEALEAGRAVLDALEHMAPAEGAEAEGERALLAALVHQNRGVCLALMGRYEDALTAYDAAEHYYRGLDMKERIGDINNNRGIALLQLGRAGEALAAFEAAAAIRAEAGLTLLQAQTLINIGDAHLLLGNYTRSLDALEQARDLIDAIEALAERHILLLDTADAYLALNLYPEALAAYREADQFLRDAGMAHHRARALWGMGAALVAQGQLEEARRALEEAAALFTAADNVPLLSSVMLEQAAVLAAAGDGEGARATARQALLLVSGNGWPVQRVYAHLRLADLLLPDLTEAERHLQEARRLAEPLALPHLRYRLNQRLGHVRLLQGRREDAQTLLEAAVEDVERLRGTLAREVLRTSFLRDKVTAYEDLVQLYLSRGEEAGIRLAFATAERAKSRALVDLLSGVAAPKPATAADPELSARLQVLQADLNAIYNELLGTGNSRPDRTPELQARAIALEQEIGRLRLRAALTAATPDPFAAPLTLDAIQEQLSPDLTLLAYHIVGAEVLAFVATRDQVRVLRGLSTPSQVRQLLARLTAQWDRFRAGRAFVSRHMARLERSVQRLLASLYEALVAPLEETLDDLATSPPAGGEVQPRKLAIVPHGLLHQVPFHALYDGKHYVLERFEVAYAPSATVLVLCQGRGSCHSGRALVMGTSDPQIPAVVREVQAVACCLPQAEVRLDGEATLTALRKQAPGCEVLHLACHGLFRTDNPMFSALKLHDGWLTAIEVMDLEVQGALVTLSACESGRSQVIVGDEIVGLTRAFLGAGAATLLVTLWLVQDETTARLMAMWYQHLGKGMERAAALRAAQLALMDEYPHPYYWAPFVLVGRGW